MQQQALSGRVVRWLAIGFGAVIIGICLLIILLQTNVAKNRISASLSALLSNDDRQVEFGALEGIVPVRMRFDHITISDPEGQWLKLEDVHLDWSPLNLLRGRIVMDEVSASRVYLPRLPKTPEEEAPKETSLPRLPEKLPPVSIRNLSMPEVDIGKSVAGQSAVFRVKGSMLEADSGSTAVLRVERTDDGPPTRLNAMVNVHGAPMEADVQIDFREAEGGWIAAVAGLDAGSIALDLRGEGPLSAWRGSIDGRSPRYGAVETAIFLETGRELKILLEGKYGDTGSLLPPKLLPLIGRETVFALDIRLPSTDLVRLQKVRVEGGGYAARLQGKIDLQSNSLDVNLGFDMDDLEVLEPAAELPLSGKLAFDADIAGPLNRLGGTAVMNLRDLKVDRFRAEKVSAEVRFDPLAAVRSGSAGLSITGSGEADGLALLDGKPLPEESLHWSLGAEVPRKGNISVSAFEIKGRRNELKLNGRLDPDKWIGTLDALFESKDLTSITAYAGSEVPGEATLEVRLTGNGIERSASASVQGRATPLEGADAPLARAIGSRLDIVGTAELREGTRVSVSGLRVESPVFQFESRGSMNLADLTLKAGWNLSVPELEPLSAVVGQSLSGNLKAQGRIDGPIGAFQASVVLEGSSVALQKVELQEVLLQLQSHGLPDSPQGNIELEIQTKETKGTAATAFSFDGRRLILSSLDIRVPGNEIKGNVTADLEKKLIDGNLDGVLKDLSTIGRLAGERLEGRGEIHAKLSPGEKGQQVSLRVKGSDIGSAFVETRNVTLTADVENAFGFPEGSIDVQIQGLRHSTLDVSTLSFSASGDEKGLNFKGGVDGRSPVGFDMQVQGLAVHSENSDLLTLKMLHGDLGEHAFRLLQPVELERSAEGFSMGGLNLALGPGRMKASGRLGAEQADVDVSFENLPLSMAALFGGPELSGSADGSIELSGAVSSPASRLTLRLDNVRSADAAFKDFPPASASIQGKVEGGVLSANANVQGLTQKPARLDVTLPARFSLDPLAFTIPSEGALAGRLDAETNLAAVSSFVPLDGQQISGRGVIDIELRGRVAAPELAGSIAVQNGSYENYDTGTLLKDLALNIVAQGRRLEIREASATDGNGGKVLAEGSMLLDAARSYPVEVDVKFSDATLVRRDDVTAVVDGDITLSGSVNDLALSGKLTVDRADVVLPKRLPPEMTELDVIEVYGDEHEGNGQKAPAQDEPETEAPFELGLDLRVDLPRRVFVRGWGLDSEWGGKFRVTGSSSEPVITGSLAPLRGHFEFLNRRFNMREGNISFYGDVPPVPHIDLTAESEVEDLTALLRFSGSGSDLKITLESEPQLPSDEILAQLMFGRSVTSISPTQALKLATAIRALSGGGGGNFDFVDRARQFLGLDTLEFRGSEEGFGKGTIGIGKYLTDDVYVDVEKGVGQETDKASVEVEIIPNITVESEVGSDASGGIGVNWKFDY